MGESSVEEVIRTYIDANGIASTMECLRQIIMNKFYELEHQQDDLAPDYHKVALKVEKIGLCFNYL